MAELKTAFYRKYRPKKFSDVLGQDDISLALKNQLIHGKVGHAYIFTGIRGTGKTTFARILAKAVNCPNTQDGEPCGVCDICAGIDNGSMLDVTEIDAASNSGVDNVRMLREETAYYPTICRMRVYIIDEVHMLTREAFNALLKIMEEPPDHVLFILATTEIHKVPATILSRCQRFELHRLQSADIQKSLREIADAENIEITDEAAAMIARLSDGALRDAQSLLDTCASLGGRIDEETVARLAGISDKNYLFELCGEIAAKKLDAVFLRLQKLYNGSMDPTRLCLELIQHYRNLLLFRMNDPNVQQSCSAEEADRYRKQSAGIGLQDIIDNLSILAETAGRMSDAPERMLVLELCLIQLCGQRKAPVSQEVSWAKPDAASPAKPQAAAPPEPKREAPPAPKNAEPAPIPAEQPAPAPEPKKPESTPPEVKEPEPQISEKRAKPAAVETLLEDWQKVVDSLLPDNGMLYGYLSNSRAYLTDTHVLIDADESFMAHIRNNNAAKDLIKDALQSVAGIKLPIGPYTRAAGAAEKRTDDKNDEIDLLMARAKENGVDVEIVE